jgi:hypothetical protein
MFDWLMPLVSGGVSAYGQYQANKTNVDIANRQMDFQERMSSTAYQRAMQDMKKAGLNPLLAYQKGGASTPSGASTQVQDELGKGVASALEYKRLMADLEQIRSQTEMNKALTAMYANEALIKKPSADLASDYGRAYPLVKWLAEKGSAGLFGRAAKFLNPKDSNTRWRKWP